MIACQPAEAAAALLVRAGLGVVPPPDGAVPAWVVTSYSELDNYDGTITTFDTGGVLDGSNMRTGERLYHPSFQIRVRGWDAGLTRRQLDMCVARLSETRYVTLVVNGYTATVASVKLTSPPASLGRADEKQRWTCVASFLLTFQP